MDFIFFFCNYSCFLICILVIAISFANLSIGSTSVVPFELQRLFCVTRLIHYMDG